jgi:hypothetical protein
VITRSNGLLTPEARKTLSRLLGHDVFMLYTRSVHVRQNHLEVPDISFALNNTVSSESFLIVRPVWEVDSDLADYGWLEILTSGMPEQIKYEHGSPAQLGSVGLCSTINLTPASPISGISLLSKNLWSSELPDTETWPFHFAVLFEHQERFKYMISYEPSAFCQLRFTFDENEIETLRKSAERVEVLESAFPL